MAAACLLVFLAVACSNDDASQIEQQGIPPKTAPMFSGTDQRGNEFRSEDLKGHAWIASFFFTSCMSVCPKLNGVQAGLQKEYGDKLKFVSISTDPDNDSVSVLSEYSQRFGAKYGTWWMIRMPIDSVRSVSAKGFALMDPREPAMHSTRFAAVDKHMNIIGYFDSEDSTDVKRLKSWISSLQ
jgi:protein SCO1/2